MGVDRYGALTELPTPWRQITSIAVLLSKIRENVIQIWNRGLCVHFGDAGPSFLLQPVIVDTTNYEKILVESGFYQQSQLQG